MNINEIEPRARGNRQMSRRFRLAPGRDPGVFDVAAVMRRFPQHERWDD